MDQTDHVKSNLINEHTRLMFLPEELVTEILVRLPVKSLSRYNAVCRLWHKIIKSQTFIHSHHKTYPSTGFLVCLVGYLPNEVPRLPTFLVNCSLFPPDYSKSKEIDPGRVPGAINSMRGPYNGVFCVHRHDFTYAFWNPATGGLRNVPLCPLRGLVYGFGIDPLTDALKIVVIGMYSSRDQFAVYNSRDDAWGLYRDDTLYNDDGDYYVTSDDQGQPFLDGFCYWIWVKRQKNERPSILAFDWCDDSFQDIEMLAGIIKPDYRARLDLYDGALALISYDQTVGRVEIWVMKERGCWKHLSSVDLSFGIFEPIGILKTNEIYVCDARYHLIIYDTDTRRKLNVEYNRIRNAPVYNVFAHPYKESLTPV